MDEAFKLGGQRHVDDEDGEDEDLPSLAPAGTEFPGFSVEFQLDAGRKDSFRDFLGFIDRLTERASLGLTADLGTPLASKVGDGVYGALLFGVDEITDRHELAALGPDIKVVEFIGNQSVGAPELCDDVVLFAFEVETGNIQPTE